MDHNLKPARFLPWFRIKKYMENKNNGPLTGEITTNRAVYKIIRYIKKYMVDPKEG